MNQLVVGRVVVIADRHEVDFKMDFSIAFRIVDGIKGYGEEGNSFCRGSH